MIRCVCQFPWANSRAAGSAIAAAFRPIALHEPSPASRTGVIARVCCAINYSLTQI